MPPRTRTRNQQQQAAAAASVPDQVPNSSHDLGAIGPASTHAASSHRNREEQNERLSGHQMQSPSQSSHGQLAQVFGSPHAEGTLSFPDMHNQSLMLQSNQSQPRHQHQAHQHLPQHPTHTHHHLQQELRGDNQSQPQDYTDTNYGGELMGRSDYGGQLAAHSRADQQQPGHGHSQPVGVHNDQLMGMQPQHAQPHIGHTRSATQMFRPPSRSLGQASEAANRHLEELSAINTAVRRSDGGHNANAQASEGLLRLSGLSAARSAGQHGAFMNTYGSSTPTSMTTSASFSGTHTPSLSRSLSPTSSINSSFTNGTGQSLASSAAAAMANSAGVKIKKRLSNVDRKQICEYARDHPHERQEVVGNHFGVERSTVSKIMKEKDKWLAIDVEREGHVVKHRNARFPEIEKEVCVWLAKEAKRPSDKEIMNKAAKIAAAHGELTFKASAGWLVKFRERLGRQGLRFGHVPARKLINSALTLTSPGATGTGQPYHASPLGSPIGASSIAFLDNSHTAGIIGQSDSASGMHTAPWSNEPQPFGSADAATFAADDTANAQIYTQTTPRASKRRAETMLHQSFPAPISSSILNEALGRDHGTPPQPEHHVLGKRQRGKKARTTPDASAIMAINQTDYSPSMPSSMSMPLFDQRQSDSALHFDKARRVLELALGTQDGSHIQIPAELLEHSRALRQRDLHGSSGSNTDLRDQPHEEPRSEPDAGRRHTRSMQAAQKGHADDLYVEEHAGQKVEADSGLSTPNHPHDDSGMQIDSRAPSGSPSDAAGHTSSKGKGREQSRAVIASLDRALPAFGLQLDSFHKRSSSSSSSGASSNARVSVNEAQTCVDTIIRFLQEHPSLSQKADDFLYWGTLKGYLNAMVEQERHETDDLDGVPTSSQEKRANN